MNRGFRETYPRSQKNAYSENSNISFLLKIPDGMELIANSIALQGVLKYTKNGNPVAYTDNIFFDEQAGVHCFFDNWVTKVQQLGITEHLNEYARYVKMMEQVNSNDRERLVMSSKNLELKTAGQRNTLQLLRGIDAGSTNFVMKPVFALNRTNRNISSKDMIEAEINFVLQDQFKACYGTDNTPANNASYTIEGLKLTYMIQPISQASSGALLIRTVSVMKHSIDSQLNNIELVLPINTESIATSVSLRNNLGGTNNNQNIDTITINNIKYLFNDTNGKLVAFNIDNYEELMYQYSRVLKLNNNDIDSIKPQTKNYGFGIELFDEQQAGNKVSIELNSDADTGAGRVYEAYSFFHGTISL